MSFLRSSLSISTDPLFVFSFFRQLTGGFYLYRAKEAVEKLTGESVAAKH